MVKRKHRIKILALIAGLLLCGFLFLMNQMQSAATDYGDKSVVYKYELTDFLKIADLDAEESSQILLPRLSGVLTAGDEKTIFDTLGFSRLYEEKEDTGDKAPLTRQQWCADYEKLIKGLGRDDIQTITIQYQGAVPGEDRIITDSGNYNTTLPADFWIYGNTHVVYASDTDIYGVKEEKDTGEKEEKKVSEQAVQLLPEKVNVLLTNDNGQKPYRKSFEVLCKSKCTLKAGEKSKTFKKGTRFTAKNLEKYFGDGVTSVTLTPEKNRTLYMKCADTGKWSDPYRGTVEIHKNKSGWWIVNTVSTEEYLYGVVPGEMPESFETEALKAQAVCARTFVCASVSGDKYKSYGADVDDSVNSQVYNKNGENKKTTQAVDATKGMILKEKDKETAADIYYFSSSCGFTSGLEAWGQTDKAPSYLKSVTTLVKSQKVKDWDKFLKETDLKAYDSHSRYFRWKAYVTLPDGYSISIAKRESSGVVTDLVYKKGKKTRHVKTENKIRQDLGKYMVKITDARGKTQTNITMLPSAFFTIEKEKGQSYVLYGGGYGHGIGMSQYGADGMASRGSTYKEILEYYFPGITLTKSS